MTEPNETELVPAVIVDKSALFRAGLMHILAGSRFRVAAACARPDDLPDDTFFGQHRCVALIGLDPDLGAALSWVSSRKESHKGLRVIVLGEQLQMAQALSAIEAGADGYVLKNEISPDGLLKSLELILVEGIVVPQGFLSKLNQPLPSAGSITVSTSSLEPTAEPNQLHPVHKAVSLQAVAADPGLLSSREHAILRHLTQGASNKHIARQLNIAEATVKVHVKSLLRKIRVSNRTQAAMWAVSHGEPLNGQEPTASDPL
jgi:two-component system nitrate/nitrite response regulator NarL